MYTLVLQKSVGNLTPCKFHVSFLSEFRHFVAFCLQKIFHLNTKVLHPSVGFLTPCIPLFPIFRET
jgi:hypothetical protein